ncbi:MAG: cell division protein FtsK, partial [Clostridiales bacterium]
MAAKKTASRRKSSATVNKKKKAINKNMRDTIWAISLFAVALCIIVFFVAAESAPLCKWTTSFLFGVFGGAAIAVPIVMIYIGVILILRQEKLAVKIWLSSAFVVLLSVFINICTMPEGAEKGAEFSKIISALYFDGARFASGGIVGGAIALPLTALATAVGAGIIVFTFMLVSLVLATGFTFSDFIGTPEERKAKKEERLKLRAEVKVQKERVPVKEISKPVKMPLLSDDDTDDFKKQIDEIADKYDTELSFTTNLTDNNPEKEEKITKDDIAKAQAEISNEITEQKETETIREYVFPGLELLKEPSHTSAHVARDELVRMGEKLTDALMSFGVETKITHVSRGPTVTRYELEPGRGVKISKITNLSDDIALNLAAKGVRIEAPIPGKEAIGIEVPNQTQQTVFLREVLDSREFRESDSKITAALGKDISGENVVIDIAKMPHLLIAGTTGTGKSVCINSILISILYKASPEEVKLILVDPKMVEFTVYKGVPHLLIPVVTDAKKAAGALSWAVSEMLSRYQMFAEKGVRDFNGYNRNVENGEKKLPQIVIVIDELSDLMMASPKEVEDAVCRLAQMARAAGMHLVVATQRPSA